MTTASFEQNLLRQVAASLGVSYAEISRESVSAEYSWARINMARTWRRAEVQRKAFADVVFARVVLPLLIDMTARAFAARFQAEQQRVIEFYEARL